MFDRQTMAWVLTMQATSISLIGGEDVDRASSSPQKTLGRQGGD
jgi:hypothetical protein